MKALVTASLSDQALNELKKHMQVTYESWRDTGIIYFDVKELAEKLKDYDVFITVADDLKKPEFFEQTNLKLIVSCRGDPFNINLNSATKKAIPIIYTPMRNIDAVADLTVGYMISLSRNICQLDRFLHSEDFEIIDFKDWIDLYNRFMGHELKEKIVGIIGFGQIGQRVAERLKCFGVNFLIYDPFVSDDLIDKFGEKVELEYIMKNSDFISVHAAATDDNDNLINGELITMMKSTAYLLNLAKGSLVDYDALYKALKTKKIAGAALDVFPLEPIDEDNDFLELENVIISPHFGGNTSEVIDRQSEMIIEDIKLWLNKEIPKHVLNPEVFKGTITKDFHSERLIDKIKQDIVIVCKRLLNEGHVIGSAGNVSVRVKMDKEEFILITPSNIKYSEMVKDDILLINFDGKVVKGDKNPSVEKQLHLGIYKAREDINAIIHSHGIYSTILSTLNLSLPPVIEELIPYLGGEIECAEYGEAGSEELAENVVTSLGEKSALILANHGNVCCGSHLEGSYTVLEYLERGAKIYYLAKLLKDPNLLPEDTVDFEKDIFEIFKESKKI
jgi:L-ribulose-5-phosphate 4-epimerase